MVLVLPFPSVHTSPDYLAYLVSQPHPVEASPPDAFLAPSCLQGPFWSLHPGGGALILSLWGTDPSGGTRARFAPVRTSSALPPRSLGTGPSAGVLSQIL